MEQQGNGATTNASNGDGEKRDEDLESKYLEGKTGGAVQASDSLRGEDPLTNASTRSADPACNPSSNSSLLDTHPIISFPEQVSMIGKTSLVEKSSTGSDEEDVEISSDAENIWLHKPTDHFIETGNGAISTGSGEPQANHQTAADPEGEHIDGDLVRTQRHEIGALRNSLEKERREKQRLQEQVSDVKTVKESLEMELESLKQNLQSEMSRHADQVREREKDLQRATEECDRLKAQLAEKELNIQQMRQRHKKDIQDITGQKDQEIASLCHEHKKQVESLKAKTDLEKANLACTIWKIKYESEHEVGKLNQEISQKELDLKDTKMQLVLREKELAEKDSKITKLQAQLDTETLTRENEELRRKLVEVNLCDSPKP